MANKKETLSRLRKEIESNKKLPFYRDANLVFGEGDENAEIMFIGEAPGAEEDLTGRPFVGRAGKLLDKLLTEIKLPRESVYITNIVKRRPPKNRDPLPDEIAAYEPYLKKQIQIINPKIIAPLGRFAMNYFLSNAKISQSHAVPSEVLTEEGQRFIVMPLYHPAAALRSTKILKDLEADFKKLPALVKKCDNKRKSK